jgi:hypothetical protein
LSDDTDRPVEFDEYGYERLRKDAARYKVLEFETNRVLGGNGLVAYTDDNSMVFLKSGYEDVVRQGEIWLCSVIKNDNGIRYAKPLEQVTLAMLMQMSDELRRSIEDSLWDRNRSAYDKAFRERFISEEYDRIRREIQQENKQTVMDLENRINELETQLEQKKFALESMRYDERDEIVLSSDPVRQPVAPTFRRMYPEDEPLQYHDADRRMEMPRAFKVRRFGPRSFQSEFFTGRRCFVHISPSRKYVLVRFHDDGNIYCFNHTISIGGLERISEYVEGAEYNAEYNKKYEGILINLLS